LRHIAFYREDHAVKYKLLLYTPDRELTAAEWEARNPAYMV